MDLELVEITPELYYSPKYGFVITKEALDGMDQDALNALLQEAQNGQEG